MQASETAPSVLNTTRLKFENSGAVTVTDIVDGQDGQLVVILGDGNTTLQDNSRLVLGDDILLEADKIYLLVYLDGAWYPTSVLAATEPTAGAGISVASGVVTNKYVGKAVTLYAGSVLATIGGPHPFPNNNRQAACVVDTTSMGQYRISVTGQSAGAGNVIPQLSYSTDGSSWSNDTALSAMNTFNTVADTRVSAWTTLPAGAIGATIYLSFRSQITFADVTVFTVTLELKP